MTRKFVRWERQAGYMIRLRASKKFAPNYSHFKLKVHRRTKLSQTPTPKARNVVWAKFIYFDLQSRQWRLSETVRIKRFSNEGKSCNKLLSIWINIKYFPGFVSNVKMDLWIGSSDDGSRRSRIVRQAFEVFWLLASPKWSQHSYSY